MNESVRVAAVAVAMIVSGCAAEPVASDVPTGPTQAVTVDGIVVTLTVERATLPSGSPSRASVSIVNRSPVPRLWAGGGCDFPASIDIRTAADVTPNPGRRWDGLASRLKELLVPRPGPSRIGAFIDERFADNPGGVACTADLGVNTLAAGATLSMATVWNGQVNATPAAAGPALVTATFPYLGAGAAGAPDPFAQPHPIPVSVAVDVSAAPDHFLSPGEAVDAALANADFASWMTAAGPMSAWDGVDLEAREGVFVVVLYANQQAGRATVDRRTGAVRFEVKPRT